MKISPAATNYKAQSSKEQSFEGIRYKKKYLSAAQNAIGDKVLKSKYIKLFKGDDIHLSIEEVPFSSENIFCKVWKGVLESREGYQNQEKWLKFTQSTSQGTIDSKLLEGISYAEIRPAKYKPVEDSTTYKVIKKLTSWMDYFV